MIMTYIKIVAAVFMLAHPADRVAVRAPASNTVVMTRPPELSSKPAPRSTKATAHRAREARGEKSNAAAPVLAAKPAKPKSSDAPPASVTDPQPAANAAVDTGTVRAYNAIPPLTNAVAPDSNSDTKTTQQQVMAAMTVAELLTTFRQCPVRDRGSGSDRRSTERGSDQGDRSPDRRRSTGRDPDSGVSGSGGKVSRRRRLPDFPGSALAALTPTRLMAKPPINPSGSGIPGPHKMRARTDHDALFQGSVETVCDFGKPKILDNPKTPAAQHFG